MAGSMTKPGRRCGECSLCCRLLPMTERLSAEAAASMRMMVERGLMSPAIMAATEKDFEKRSGERCKHQRRSGCAIYERRPFGCRFWNCRWLVNDDTDELRRPDRSHYVIDVMPDFIVHELDGVKTKVPVVQIWVDERYPDAHRDPALRAYVERRATEGYMALIRYNERDAFLLVAPAMNDRGAWLEIVSNTTMEREHSVGEVLRVMTGIAP